jgi:molybdenum cofactor synthesis domain-containing protein
MGKPGFGKLMALSDALALTLSRTPELGTERVSTDAALGRVLTGPVEIEIDVPHFAKAAMDGYAVRAEDTYGAGENSPLELHVVGHVTPGQLTDRTVGEKECIEISTGAPMPGGANATLMVENTEAKGNSIVVYKTVAPGQNVIGIGSDLKAGTSLFRAGLELAPRHIGVLAAVGLHEVEVRRTPHIALMSTGNEILGPGEPLAPGKIYNINSTTLGMALRAFGCTVSDLGIVKDTPDDVKKAISSALGKADVIMLSGGSSLGRGDMVPETMREFGELLFHGIAVKPGKPTALAVAGDKLIFGLPGYPTSALSNYYILIEPVLEKMTGRRVHRRYITARLDRKVLSTVGRYQFLPVRIEEGVAIPVVRGSSSITTLAVADGFVEVEENVEVVEKGAQVTVRLF